ncbi:hypothetical protein ACJJTC_019757 [Scirpophaga incertulas]
MDAITVTVVLLVNQFAQASVPINSSVVTALSENSSEAIFALQIQEFQGTTEVTPAGSTGYNLNNVGGAATSSPVAERNIAAISTIHSKKTERKKHNDDIEGNVEFYSIDENYRFNNNESRRHLAADEIIGEAEPLVWDSCLETTYKESDDHRNLIKLPSDMEIASNDTPIKDAETNSVWKKRDANSANYTEAMKAWLAKYNNLLKGKTEERRQQRPESIFIRKLTDSPTTPAPVPTTTVHVIAITREIFKESPEKFNITQQPVVTEISIKASYTEDWFEAKDRGKIRFSGLPQKDTYLIPALKLEEGFHPFAFMSEFFTVIYPFDFPVGLIKDIVWGKFTFPYSFIQSIKVESTFLAFIIAFACIALVIPSYFLILFLLSLFSKSRCDDETETGALFPDADESDCNDRVLVVVTLFVVLICCVLISGMAVSNEQAHAAAMDSRNVIHCACADLASWLVAAARELHHSLIPPIDLVLHAYREDLKNIGVLLGEPIQQAIASESGVDLVFDSLADIITESEDLALKITALRDVSMKAGSLAAATADRVTDLAHQLDNLKQHCTLKDTPLCDTVNTNFLEIQIKFEWILRERQLLELRALGVNNLTRAISTARKEFRSLPSAISTQTIQARKDIINDVETRRLAVHNSVKVLNDIVRHVTTGLHSVSRQIEAGLDRIQKYDMWRWTLMLVCSVTFGFVMILITLAMICGCGHAKDHGKRTLQVSAVWLCFTSLILWGVISATFLMTGHAEVYVCHALWDKPQYESLSALLDKPSPLLANEEGIFDDIFRDLDNVTIDVSVKDVLRECEKDRPAYTVFQLDKVLDVNKETSYFEWGELQADLGRLASSIDVGLLKTISFDFNRLLNQMLVVSDVDLAKYRMDYNGPIMGRDLPSLVDQLQNIAAQVSDLTTAGRLETLATRTKRLYMTSIKPLEQARADIVYKLTELELQLMPFRRKLNISLSHIHTAQYYIDNQGDVIAQKHGWWFCGVLLGLIWCSALTPLCVRLWRAYGWKIRANEVMNLANLSTGPPPAPRSDSW